MRLPLRSPIAARERAMRLPPAAARPPAPPMPAAGRAASALWWLHPLAAIAAIAGVYASFMAFDFARVVPRPYIPGPLYGFGALLLFALAVGAATMTVGRAVAPPRPAAGIDIPSWAMALLLAVTVFAYAVWFAPLAANPGLVLEIVHGERSNLRNVISTQPGVTTMTQFGVAYAIGHAALLGGGVRRLRLWEHVGLGAVFVLAALRAFVWSERLAVIELAVCSLVAWLAFARVRRPAAWRLAALLPLAAPLLLYVMFTGTEYFRSWEFYRDQYESIWDFSFERLVAYYATAANNGIGLLAESREWPLFNGRYVFEWLYQMPQLGDTLRQEVGDAATQYQWFLEQFARPEFNNPSGLFPVVYDLGYVGSLLYFLLAGALVGRLWDAWRSRAVTGVLFYPPAVLFAVELLRFNYFASTRFFPVALALLALAVVSRRVPSRV